MLTVTEAGIGAYRRGARVNANELVLTVVGLHEEVVLITTKGEAIALAIAQM